MPTRFWVPLATRQLPDPTHLHAAMCEWFDRSAAGYDGVGHHDGIKPYRVSAPTSHDGVLGVEISTLTAEITDRLFEVIEANRFIRLGSEQQVAVGDPLMLIDASWEELTRASARAGDTWRVHFLTPTIFRSGKHPHVLPTPTLVLRGAETAWMRFSGFCRVKLPRETNRSVLVTDLNLATDSIRYGKVRHTGLVGYADYRCVDAQSATGVAPLFSLLPFTSVGSHKGKGLGCVEVELRSQTTRSDALGHEQHHVDPTHHNDGGMIRRPRTSA